MQSEPITMRPKVSKTSEHRTCPIALVSLAFSTLLVACGGGESDKTALQNAHESRTQAQASTVSPVEVLAETPSARREALAVPPGWIGRPPTYEVINGITVPPEPAPALNNATLPGIDTNRNGVRDDVERLVAGGSTTATYDKVTLPIAKLQNRLAVENSLTVDEVMNILTAMYCLEKQRSPNDRMYLPSSAIQIATLNTPSRNAVASENLRKYFVSTSSMQVPNCLD